MRVVENSHTHMSAVCICISFLYRNPSLDVIEQHERQVSIWILLQNITRAGKRKKQRSPKEKRLFSYFCLSLITVTEPEIEYEPRI